MANNARKLAPDANVAEKGVEIEGGSRKTVLSVIEKFLGFFVNIVQPEGRSEGGDSPKVVPSNQDKSNDEAYESDLGPFTQYCSDNANVWKYYMHRATVLDDELAKVLNGDLDPLLIFAGLFSAILSAFLIEIRKGLQEDLQDTTNALLRILIQDQRNLTIVPTTSRFEPTSTSSWVNGLWFSSLMFSLMSALGASLAKGWVTQYSSTGFGTTWRDAASHHRRYKGMLRWGMRLIIQCLPILIHIAFFLFAIGLTVLLFNDDIRIGGVVLALVFMTASLYVAAIVHVYRVPDSPFRTPVSDLISWLTRSREAGRQLEPSPTNSTGDYLFKAEALGWLLTESADSDVITETVRAIAGISAGPNVQDKLYHLSVVNVLSQGLSKSIDDNKGDKTDTLKAYLHAVLRLVQTKPRVSEPTSDPICDVLVSMVNSGGSLHLSKCRTLNSELYEVALCVNARIHLIFKKERDETLFGTDIPVLMRSTKQRYIRQLLLEVHLLGGTQRGIGPEFANTDSYLEAIMSDNLREDGHKALVRRAQSDEYIMTSVSAFGIMTLLEGLQSSSFNVCNEYLERCSDVCSYPQFRSQICERGVLVQLFMLFRNQDHALRKNAENIIQKLSDYDDTWEVFDSPTIQEEIVKGLKGGDRHIHELLCGLACTFAKHEKLRLKIITAELVDAMLSNCGVEKRSADRIALRTIRVLAIHDNVRLPVTRTVVQRLHASLSADGNLNVWKEGLNVIGELAKHDDSRVQIMKFMNILIERLGSKNPDIRQAALNAIMQFVIHDDSRIQIVSFMPALIERLLGDDTSSVREAAMNIIIEFATHDDSHAHVADFIVPSLAERLGDNREHVRQVAINIIEEFKRHENSCAHFIPLLMGRLDENNSDLPWQAIGAIKEFVSHDHSCAHVADSIPSVMKKIKGKNPVQFRKTALITIKEFAKHNGCRAYVTDLIPSLTEMLGNNAPIVRQVAIDAIKELLLYDDCRAHVTKCIPTLIERLEDNNQVVQEAAINIVANFARHDDSRVHFISSIPTLIKRLGDNDSDIQQAAINAIKEFVVHDNSGTNITNYIPALIGVLCDKDSDVRQAAILFINEFVTHDCPADSWVHITNFIPALIERLGDGNWVIREVANDIIKEFAMHDDCRVHLANSIPALVKRLGDKYSDVRLAAINAIKEFVIHDDSRMQITNFIPVLIHRLGDNNLDVRVVAVDIIKEFAIHDDSRTDVTNSIQALIKRLDGDSYKEVDRAVAAIDIIKEFAIHDDLRAHVLYFIPLLVKKLGNSDLYFRGAAFSTIKEFAIHDDSYVHVMNFIPTLFQLLDNIQVNLSLKEPIVKIFMELIKHDDGRMQVAQGLIETIIHVLVPDDRDYGMNLLVKLTDYSDIHAKLSAPDIIELVVSQLRAIQYSGSQETYGKILMHLFFLANESGADYIYHRVIILLADPDSSVVRVALQILSDLAKRESQRKYLCESFEWAHFSALLSRHDMRVVALTALRGLAQYGDILEVMSHEFRLVSSLLDMLKSKSDDIERWIIGLEGLLLLGLFS